MAKLKSSKKKEKKKARKRKIPKTVQQSIPYKYVYEDSGIIEVKEGFFTRSYLLQDINYQIAKEDEQDEIFYKYCDVLNSFDPSLKIQISINNRSINADEFVRNTLIGYKKDDYDHLREEYNNMLADKLSEGKNNIKREKYITVGMESNSYENARMQFSRIDAEMATNFKDLGNSSAIPLTTMERLEILHDIYNLGEEGTFGMRTIVDKQEIENFSFPHMRKQGLTTKDVIAPMSLAFKTEHIKIDDKFARALYLDKLPTYLKDKIVNDLVSVNINMLTSINLESVPQDKAIKLVQNQITGLDVTMLDRDSVSHALRTAKAEADLLMNDLTSRNQKMFLMTFVIVHFADTLEQLNDDTDTLRSIARGHICSLDKLFYQQEAAFTSALPLANNKIQLKRTLTTESTAVFMPFSSQELAQKNGMYYGLNAVSRNLILYDRFTGDNYNGFILGTSGSGKSFSAKREMLNVLLNTDDDVIVIDPEREYSPMAEILNGEVIRISPGSKVHINPMDMDADYADDDNPINLKYSFLISLFETIIGGVNGLSPVQKSIIDRTIGILYKNYMVDFDPEKIPTLLQFQALLKSQSEREAKELAVALEIYTSGSLDIFAHQTNVDVKNRFTVYDIKDVGSSMKTMSMLVVLDNIWNKMIENRKKGRKTWFYIDEIYLLFNNEVSAQFLQQIYKRARKWNGVPTGITQNIEDILRSETARTMLSNSSFIMMLNQAPLDRRELAELLNISDTQLSYITNSSPGEGLIYTGRFMIPFLDKFPTNTDLYRAMTTKPGE